MYCYCCYSTIAVNTSVMSSWMFLVAHGARIPGFSLLLVAYNTTIAWGAFESIYYPQRALSNHRILIASTNSYIKLLLLMFQHCLNAYQRVMTQTQKQSTRVQVQVQELWQLSILLSVPRWSEDAVWTTPLCITLRCYQLLEYLMVEWWMNWRVSGRKRR
jgi:hypothetical protein